MDSYDEIVVGAGYAGITAAAYLAKAGRKVLLLESHTTLGGCAGYFKKGGFRFEAGATTLTGAGPNGPLGRIISEMKLNSGLRKLDRAMIIHEGEDRFIRWADTERWTEELARIAPENPVREFAQWVDRTGERMWGFAQSPAFPPMGIVDLARCARLGPVQLGIMSVVSVMSFLEMMPRALRPVERFRKIVDEQLLISAQGVADAVPASVGALGMAYPNDLYYPTGGISALGQELAERFKQFGGTLSLRDKVESIETSLNGFEVSSKRGRRKCRRLLLAIPLWNLPGLFSRDRDRSRLQRKADQWPDAWAAITWTAALHFEKEPQDLYHQIHFDEGPEEIASGSMFVSLSATDDEARAPEDWRVVTVSVHVREKDFDMDRFDKRYAETKERVGRFIESRLRSAFEEYKIEEIKEARLGTPKTFEWFTNRMRGRVGGLPWKAGAFPLSRPGFKLPIENAYLLGDTALPGQGVAGVAMGGRKLACWLTR